MDNLSIAMQEYRAQLKKGSIQKAYKGLMDYIMGLRAYFDNKYPDHFVPGNIYFGYMDMTYFSFTSKALKDRNLKVAVVFVHETFRFEAWLAGVNKQVQGKYWKVIKESGWNKYPLVPGVKGNDAILEHILVADPDFGDLNALTSQVEEETLKFIEDIENFINTH